MEYPPPPDALTRQDICPTVFCYLLDFAPFFLSFPFPCYKFTRATMFVYSVFASRVGVSKWFICFLFVRLSCWLFSFGLS